MESSRRSRTLPNQTSATSRNRELDLSTSVHCPVRSRSSSWSARPAPGLRGAPAGHATGYAVEVAEAGNPLAVVAAYLDRAVVPESEGRTCHGRSSEEGSDKFGLRRQQQARAITLWPMMSVRREGIEPPTRWLGVAWSADLRQLALCWSGQVWRTANHVRRWRVLRRVRT